MDGCVGWVGWGEGNRSRKSTSPCDILLPLLSADWCPKLLRHLTSDAHTSLLKNLTSAALATSSSLCSAQHHQSKHSTTMQGAGGIAGGIWYRIQ